MPISQIPIFSMLRTRMEWHQERQRLLAAPNLKPRDLAPALHAAVEIDREIAPEHCKTVAEVIGYVTRLRRGMAHP